MTHQQQSAFENIVGKGEIAHNDQFLLFPQCFLLNQIPVIVSPLVHIFDIVSLLAAEFKEPKIGISGKELRSEVYCKNARITKPKIPNILYMIISTNLPTEIIMLTKAVDVP